MCARIRACARCTNGRPVRKAGPRLGSSLLYGSILLYGTAGVCSWQHSTVCGGGYTLGSTLLVSCERSSHLSLMRLPRAMHAYAHLCMDVGVYGVDGSHRRGCILALCASSMAVSLCSMTQSPNTTAYRPTAWHNRPTAWHNIMAYGPTASCRDYGP